MLYVCYKFFTMKNLLFVFALVASQFSFAQYGYRDGNRIGISGGISNCTIFSSTFDSKPGNGFAGGLSVRGNYYNNWSMIYGMQFFESNFSLGKNGIETRETEFSLQGVQIRLLFSYNVIQDHISIDFGPVLQVNGKLSVNKSAENNVIKYNNVTEAPIRAKDVLDVSTIGGAFYFGVSGGTKVVRLVAFYQYGFTNLFNKLNKNTDLTALNNTENFKGNLGTINAQVVFNL
ncbi:MAG: hypothetical protein RLZZ500_2309 [Bacteroidota bacterium]